MIPPPHWVFGPDRISVRCGCGAWPKQPHVIGLEYFCGAGCCPVCNPVAELAAVAGMVGAQEELL